MLTWSPALPKSAAACALHECRPERAVILVPIHLCHAGRYNYVRALEVLETGLLGGFYYKVCCLLDGGIYCIYYRSAGSCPGARHR